MYTGTKRICQIIKLKPEAEAEYKALHVNAWLGVLAALAHSNIVDYSIHYYPPLHLLISHLKYTGNDFDADMQKVAENEETRRWWALTDKMQESFVEGATGSGGEKPWWLDLEEVFRYEGQSG